MKSRLIYIAVSLLVILAIITSETMMAFEEPFNEDDKIETQDTHADEEDTENPKDIQTENTDHIDACNNPECELPGCIDNSTIEAVTATSMSAGGACICDECETDCKCDADCGCECCIIKMPAPCGLDDCVCEDCDAIYLCECFACSYKYCDCDELTGWGSCNCDDCGRDCGPPCVNVKLLPEELLEEGYFGGIIIKLIYNEDMPAAGLPVRSAGAAGAGASQIFTDESGEAVFLYRTSGNKEIRYNPLPLFYNQIPGSITIVEEIFVEVTITVSIQNPGTRRDFLGTPNNYIESVYIAPLPGRTIDLWLLGGGGGGGAGGKGPASSINTGSSVYKNRRPQGGGGGGGSGYARNILGIKPKDVLGTKTIIIGEGGPGGMLSGTSSLGDAGTPGRPGGTTSALGYSVPGGNGGGGGGCNNYGESLNAPGGRGGAGGANGGTGAGSVNNAVYAPTPGTDAWAGTNGIYGRGGNVPFGDTSLGYYGGGGGAGVGRAHNATLLGWYSHTPGGAGAGGAGGRGGIQTDNGAYAASGQPAANNSGSGGGGGAGGGSEGAAGGSPGDAGHGGNGGSGRVMMRLSVLEDFTIINLTGENDTIKHINGAVFLITDTETGEEVMTVTITERGQIGLKNTDFAKTGKYTVKQIKPAQGYELNSEEQYFETNNSILSRESLTFYNEEIKLVIKRVGSDDVLAPGSAVSISGGDEPVKDILTDGTLTVGLGQWNDMTYTVEETMPPVGYYPAQSKQFIMEDGALPENMPVDPDSGYKMLILKSSLNYITIIREDMRGNKLSGAVYRITGKSINVQLQIGNCRHLTDIPPCRIPVCDCADCTGSCVCTQELKPCNIYGCDCDDCDGNCICTDKLPPCKLLECDCKGCNGYAIGTITQSVVGNVAAEVPDDDDPEISATKITYTNWPEGIYTITEIVTPSGYKKAGAVSFRITGDGLSQEEFLLKTDENKILVRRENLNKELLPGAVFTMTRNDGQFAVRATVALADGMYLQGLAGWPDGTYTVKEIAAPQGYQLSYPEQKSFTLNDGVLSPEILIFSCRPPAPQKPKEPGEEISIGEGEDEEDDDDDDDGDGDGDEEPKPTPPPGGRDRFVPRLQRGGNIGCVCNPDCTCGEDCLCLIGGLCDCCSMDIKLLGNEPESLQDNSGSNKKLPSLLATLLAALALLLTLLLLFLLRGRKLKIMRVDENNQLLPLSFIIQGEDINIDIDAGSVVYKVKVRNWKDGLYTITERTKDNYTTENPVQGIVMENGKPDRWKVRFNCV